MFPFELRSNGPTQAKTIISYFAKFSARKQISVLKSAICNSVKKYKNI